VAIETVLTGAFGLDYPVVSAPMAGVSGGRHAAAVSNAGGLGLVGGGYGEAGWLQKEMAIARAEAERPWGVGLITWRAEPEIVDLALGYGPSAFMLSFGDPRPYARAIKAAGCALICQVQDVEGARMAVSAGADFVVAQGTEAGGHGSDARSTLPLVPALADAVSPTPVLAAGGIADGRGLAAALMLGAQGVLMGTRFYAATESLGHPRAKERLVAAAGGNTRRTRVFDVVRDHRWPEAYTGRALANPFLERWDNQVEELLSVQNTEASAFQAATERGDFDTAMVWAGEGVDLITDVGPAAELLMRVGTEAEARLRLAGNLLGGAPTG
jgi:nitronate monooxygenase